MAAPKRLSPAQIINRLRKAEVAHGISRADPSTRSHERASTSCRFR